MTQLARRFNCFTIRLATARTILLERYWGILEQHWNGIQLRDVNTMLQGAQTMIWKGVHPIVIFNQTAYAKGISLSKTAMRKIESRLERHPDLPKWDILIRPTDG